MEPRYSIAPAQPEHVVAFAGIELAAATLLEGHAPASVLEETTPESEFHEAREAGRLWVALAEDVPVGFALVRMLAEDHPHLEEMDVLPEHGRRGLGTALLRSVLDWFRRSDHPEITLTTFRAVPWNMPFYSRLGFEEVPPGELGAELEAVVRNEAERGLDSRARVAMRYRVHAD